MKIGVMLALAVLLSVPLAAEQRLYWEDEPESTGVGIAVHTLMAAGVTAVCLNGARKSRQAMRGKYRDSENLQLSPAARIRYREQAHRQRRETAMFIGGALVAGGLTGYLGIRWLYFNGESAGIQKKF